MIIQGVKVPDIFIKACSKKSYAKDILNGNIYMKELSFYRTIENQYMGDKLDGLGPIHSMKILNEKGENFFDIFPDMISVIGNLSDNKPVFCVSMLDERISYFKDGKIMLKKDFIDEMLKFGDYFVVFNGSEFASNVKKWNENTNIDYLGKPVEYCDIWKEYGAKDLFGKKNSNLFFKKDFKYEKQNEWRLVLFNESLITDKKDFYIMSIGELKTAHLLTKDEFINFTLEL